MATMKKITKPASTTIAVFVTCIEILWRDESNSSARPVGNLLMYWLRVPFSSSTGAAKAQVMKNAMMPECNQDEVERQNQKKQTNRSTAIYRMCSPKSSLPAGCVKITKRDTFECT